MAEAFKFKSVVPAQELTRPTIQDLLTPSQVVLGYESVTFPEIGVQVEQAKVFDSDDNLVHTIYIDAATGAPIDLGLIRSQDLAAYRAAQGSIDRGLLEQLAPLPSTAMVNAVAEAPTDFSIGPFSPDAPTLDGRNQQMQDYRTMWKAANAASMDALVQTLRSAGAVINQVSPDTNQVFFTATRSALETLARHPEATRLSTAPGQALPAGHSIDLDLIERPIQKPIFGARPPLSPPPSPVVIGIMDASGGCINRRHLAFADAYPAPGPAGKCELEFEAPQPPVANLDPEGQDGHVTAVAAVAASIDPSAVGDIPLGLPNARLFESDRFDREGIYDVNTVLARSPNVLNHSIVYGNTSAASTPARTFDWLSGMDRIVITKAAGNEDGFTDCGSYNAICVGGYHTNDTLAVTTPGSDVNTAAFFDDFSQGDTLNQPDGRERPDLVAPFRLEDYPVPNVDPGTADPTSAFCPIPGVRCFNTFPGFDIQANFAWGTSFGTGATSGFVAALLDGFPQFWSNPTLVRAVLMAAADHRVKACPPSEAAGPARFFCAARDPRTPPRVPVFLDGIDDWYGAGAIRGDRARAIADNGSFFSARVSRYRDFSPVPEVGVQNAPLVFNHPITIHAKAAQKIRVFLTWENCPSDQFTDQSAVPLYADFDLSVTGPLRTKANPSFHDNYEGLDFFAEADGDYTVQIAIAESGWSSCPAYDGLETFLAVAWDVQTLFQ